MKKNIFDKFINNEALSELIMCIKQYTIDIIKQMKVIKISAINDATGSPVGQIIAFMGTNAPMNYLACDGSIYNISDYPELANHLKTEFGKVNQFGGDGTTTFAVPDLRGEFLRGSGTASRNTGSGAAVGTHQNATEHVTAQTSSGYVVAVATTVSGPDKNIGSSKAYRASGTQTTGSFTSRYTSRPTNTAVLYCIKCKDTSMNYSFDERVVGTWLDGNPLYQKTIVIEDILNNESGGQYQHNISDVDIIFVKEAIVYQEENKLTVPAPALVNNVDRALISIYTNDQNYFGDGYITLRYTKITE